MKIGRVITEALQESAQKDLKEMLFKAFLNGYDIDTIEGWYFRTQPTPYRLRDCYE